MGFFATGYSNIVGVTDLPASGEAFDVELEVDGSFPSSWSEFIEFRLRFDFGGVHDQGDTGLTYEILSVKIHGPPVPFWTEKTSTREVV